jgi:asparagine synthase (glutamine-hydrolysing)
MCGICGVVGRADTDSIAAMNERLSHRGPDDEGTYVDRESRVALGHKRLSIIDLSAAGRQPMGNDDGSLVISFNGEIYNYQALRARLTAKGYRFRSNTDTEVILKLYEDEGAESVKRLNGIFAFAIWDHRRKSLFLARDHFGIKPLYYARKNGWLAFASEAKSLFALPGVAPELDTDALGLYFSFLWTPDPLTLFKGVLKLPAGHYAEWRDGDLRLTRFWDLTFRAEGSQQERSTHTLIGEFRERFGSAVERQLISDVPVGAFLSAGLDSSAIVAEMARRTREPVRTYTIAFHPRHRRGEVTLDDPALASAVARKFGCKHTEIVVDPDVAELLPRLVWHMDEPTADPAIVMAYLVSREARREVTVLLSGIGGDELLGGYRKYVAALDADRYQRIPAAVRHGMLDPLLRRAPARPGTPWGGYGRLLRKWGRSASLTPRQQFITNGTYLPQTELPGLFLPGAVGASASASVWRFHEAAFDQVRHADWLHQMMYVDAKLFMASLNLTYNDRMSMASGVEVRVPFLDWELADWLASEVPPGLKIHGRVTKYLLREAYRDTLPAGVLSARKAGFGAPIGYWLLNDLREMVDDLLHTDRVRRRGLFRPEVVESWVREQRQGSVERSWNVWQLLTFELWMQAYFDGRAGSDSRAAGIPASVTP